jgi:hypothetical protein
VVAGTEPYSSSAAGSIAGNLNIMLLSAPERMSQNLVVLTEVLAAVLKLKQEPDEPLTAFTARLIEAIATLSPAEQQKLKAMLSDAFAGLQLRTLLLALRNPQGPEAATLAIYLELYRQKERDPGARAVISFYRQNGEAALAPPIRDPRTTTPLNPSQPQPSGTLAAGQPSSSQTAAQTSSPMAPALKAAGSGTAPQAAAAEDHPVYGASGLPGSADAAEASDGTNLRILRQMRERLAATADPALATTAPPPATDRSQAASAGPVASGMGAKREVDQPSSEAPLTAMTDASTMQDEATVAEQQAASAAPTGGQPSLAGVAHLLEEVAETELIRTLLSLYGADADTETVDLALETLMSNPDEVETKPRSAQAMPIPEGETEEFDTPAPGRSLHWEEQLALATSVPLADHDEPVRAGIRSEGLPLAFVSYIIESEEETGPASLTRKEHRGDEQPDDELSDEQNASGDEAADDQAGENSGAETSEIEEDDPDLGVDLGLATPRLDASDIAPTLSPPEADPAQALYLRLSDFA